MLVGVPLQLVGWVVRVWTRKPSSVAESRLVSIVLETLGSTWPDDPMIMNKITQRFQRVTNFLHSSEVPESLGLGNNIELKTVKRASRRQWRDNENQSSWRIPTVATEIIRQLSKSAHVLSHFVAWLDTLKIVSEVGC